MPPPAEPLAGVMAVMTGLMVRARVPWTLPKYGYETDTSFLPGGTSDTLHETNTMALIVEVRTSSHGPAAPSSTRGIPEPARLSISIVISPPA